MYLEQLTKIKDKLTEKELKAYEVFKDAELPSISPIMQTQLFELFLNGKSCKEIQQINSHFELGQIVEARIIGRWDELREEYQSNLYRNVLSRVEQAQMETVVLLSDMLAVANKIHSKKLQRFLQTGNEKELGGLRVDSIRALKEVIEMLVKTTGQRETKKIKATVEHLHTPSSPLGPMTLGDEEKTETDKEVLPTSESEISDFLKLLEGDTKNG